MSEEDTLSSEAFTRWLHRSIPGDVAVYYRGNLSMARERQDRVDILAFQIMDASDKGLVYLTQRRIVDLAYDTAEGRVNFYEYLATRAKILEQPVVRRTVEWAVQ